MPLIRIAEWQRKRVSAEWTQEARDALAALAGGWRIAHRLNAAPLEWGGSNGQVLSVRQWVGVVEWGEFRVEIYPKLDKDLLASDEKGEISEVVGDSSLRALLSMIEAADYGDWLDNGRAALEYEPLQFPDVWAYLLGKNLSGEVRDGLSHAYIPMQGDLPSVRGKIAVSRQVSHHFNRADKLACVWDEWSADNALNRLLKCACAWLQTRVSHPHSRAALTRCLWPLAAVETVSPREALAQTQNFAWSRATKRFQNAFDLSRRLLSSQSPDFGAQGAQSWVFLSDMNQLFERFCARAIEAKYGAVEAQNALGTLLLNPARIRQLPDFLWRENGTWQIGDAKWKLLNQNAPQFAGEESEIESEQLQTGTLKISPDDVRQLTVYSEMLRRGERLETAPDMTIFYPSLNGNSESQMRETWNRAELKLCSVRVKDFSDVSEVLG